MTLTKAQIVESIQNQTGFPKNKSSEIVETLLEIIERTLSSDEDVLVSGFGKFRVKEKKERKGRNPATGEVIKTTKDGIDIARRLAGYYNDIV